MKNIYKRYTKPKLHVPSDGLDYWREKLLLSFIFFLVITAFIAYIPSMYLAIRENLTSIAIVDTLLYLSLIFIIRSKKTSVFTRSLYIVVIAYFLGVFLLAEVGPFGAGYLWLFIVPIIASVFMNLKYVVGTLVLNFVTLLVIGVMQHYNIIANGQEFGFTFEHWIIISANFIFIDLVASWSIILIVRGLERSYKKQIAVSNRLEKQKQELFKAKEAVENSLKIKSEFLAQVSHEIRTPLSTVLSFVSVIKAELQGKSTGEIDNSIKMIEGGSNRIIRTIELILKMSEVQTKSIEVYNQKFKLLETVLLPLHEEFYKNAVKKGLTFNCVSKMEKDIIIYADLYTVTQLFANLIDNAIKYTETGNITLTCKINEDNHMVVEVKDTGIGMSEEFMKEIYNPFSQEESGYTRRYEGIGLGLSLVKSYCNINDLKLSVISKKNIGTTFTIDFGLYLIGSVIE